jgi:hypothetical protein
VKRECREEEEKSRRGGRRGHLGQMCSKERESKKGAEEEANRKKVRIEAIQKRPNLPENHDIQQTIE